MAYAVIDNSSYLDFTGYRITDKSTVQAAYELNPVHIHGSLGTTFLNVALILERNQDPTDLLASNWGTRQQTLSQLNDAGTLWTTYGANTTLFNNVSAQLTSAPYNLTILDDSNAATMGNYVTSAESRTIWVEIGSGTDFSNLFHQDLFLYDDPGTNGEEFHFWNGDLSLPEEWQIAGLWVDTDNSPPASNFTAGVSVTLPQGPQSVGNTSTRGALLSSDDIAALYNLPLADLNVPTGAIGLIEPGIGSALPPGTDETFQELLRTYLAKVGQVGTGRVHVQGEDGQSWDDGAGGERSLDVGVVASVNPNSDIVLYNGSGHNGRAEASVFTATQSAIWGPRPPGTPAAAVISNSWGDGQSMTPGSVFYQAYWELFVDAALSNLTMFTALGDGGSGNETANGLTNLEYNITSPYGILVGGTSLSNLMAAVNDPTFTASLTTPAMGNNLAIIWQLVAGGLTSLPSNADDLQYFVESVWNQYQVEGRRITTSSKIFDGGYNNNTTSSGGVDPTQPVPAYQVDYGLNPVTSDPFAQVGRGAPDVSANAGGNLSYLAPKADMTGLSASGGTSAASPFWASLAVQLNAIFADQDLPNLGYMNDLLYIASAIAPPSFNDVQYGNNTSSFTSGGRYRTENSDDNGLVDVTPTGFGYAASPGYDLTSGLGSPNGVLLARSLTAIAHSQMWFGSSPDMLEGDITDGWTSGTDQTLLFQTMSVGTSTVGVGLGDHALGFSSMASGTYAWTNRLAQQSLQADFDPALVRLFDMQGQGWVGQSFASAGESVSVSINSASASAIQGSLSSPFGFADFISNDGAVRVARPVAVAETAGGQDDTIAIVRLRQNGQDDVSLSFFRVDDLAGAINGKRPGEAGYAAAAHDRAYQMTTGGTSIDGPGYGNYDQSGLLDVDAGDLIAMKLTNATSGNTYWGFAQANESVAGQQVGHLWSYGLNSWGFEDLYGGGDRDFNDLVFQLDFTSASGSGWLV